MSVKENIPIGVKDEVRRKVGPALFALRKSLGWSQARMGQALRVSQAQVAKWESQQQTPSGQVMNVIAHLAADEDRGFWLALAGVREPPSSGSLRSIPILRDAAAAGTPRAIDDAEIEMHLDLPRSWLPRSGSIVGVPVQGDSMSPILESGYVALVDTSKRQANLLVDRMVAARDGEGGVTLKWLRKQSDDLYLLVPQHTSTRHPIQVMRPEGEWSLVGEVVKWIGEPPAPAKRK